MMHSVLNIIFWILFIYFGLSVVYLFIFSLAGKYFYRGKNEPSPEPKNRIAVFVPAYKEDSIILYTAKNLIELNYPLHLFDVYILADSFNADTIVSLNALPVHVMEVSFDKSTKTKALNEGFRRITKPYDIALICDADNMLTRDFLNRIDYAFAQGARAVQGRRVAKNLDSSFAILDACSEAINNNIFRKGANALTLSSAVIGSGMAFEYAMCKNILGEINAVGGFDKPLQLKIVQQGVSIQYLEDALIFDEKVDSPQAFKQQRKRWISSQFIYLKEFFFPALRELTKGNVSYFNLAIANNIILPRAYLLISLPALTILALIVAHWWLYPFIVICVIYIISLILALPLMLVNKDLFYAIIRLPNMIVSMITALFQMRKTNKTFIHTVHTKTEISNTLFKDHGN